MSARLYIDPVGGVDYIIETIPDGAQFIGDKLANHGKDGDHIFAGSDAVDGDQLGVDFVPANYTRDTTPGEVTAVQHLTAHLKGIDTAILSATGITGSGTIGTIPKFTAATVLGDSLITETANKISIGPSARLSVHQGTITTAVSAIFADVTWNSGPTAFTFIKGEIADTASSDGSLLIDITVGGTSKFSVGKGGVINDSASGRSVDPIARRLFDGSDVLSLQWNDRILTDTAAATVLNWATQVMTGGWTIDGVDIDAHAARHSEAGGDTINVENLGTAETDKTRVLQSNGAAGLLWVISGILPPFDVSTTDDALTTIATLAIPTDSTLTVTVTISGTRSNGTGRGGFILSATAYREGAAAAALQGEVMTSMTRTNTTYEVGISVSGNNLIVQVKGESAHNVNWVATVVQAEAST